MEIGPDEWVDDHPMRRQTANFLETFGTVPFDALVQERERIDDVLTMLDALPQNTNDNGAAELASKQHSMWIAELIENSWSSSVTAEMNAYEEDTKGYGILLFYVFLCENVGCTNEAIIATEQELAKEKYALANFQFDIHKFTVHVCKYIRQISLQASNQ
jgi:hypothetical protein